MLEDDNMKLAFNNKKYLDSQKKLILQRSKKFKTFYLEIGGHLLYDGHASRVLPGYNPQNKLKLIKQLKNTGIIYCVSAKEIQKDRTWGNTNKKIKDIAFSELKKLTKEVEIIGVCISLFDGQKKAISFALQITNKFQIPVYFTKPIKNYPKLKETFSKFGFEAQPILITNKKIVAVTGAGANNGKLFFCLSQIYHENKLGKNTGFAKLETFPVYNLKINHPLNLAYMAATADIKDKVVIDPFYKKAYKKDVISYNRDVDAFPILKKIINKITKKENFMHNYKSPTDMGLNAITKGIINEKKINDASIKEIKRRKKSFSKLKNKSAVIEIENLIKKNKIK